MADAREAARRAARDEYRRLLYVAMTRAAERLVVCGAKGANKIPDGCWYQLVEDALKTDCVREPADDGDGEVLALSQGRGADGADENDTAHRRKRFRCPAGSCAMPSLTSRRCAASRRRAPSARTARAPAGAGVKAALLRGSLSHRLLQSLPDLPPQRRAAIAAEFLGRRGKDLADEERRRIADEVLGLLGDARCAPLFLPGSRAEVPIVGKVDIRGESYRVSGQVDRLAVTADAVLIADFKTNRPVPRIVPPSLRHPARALPRGARQIIPGKNYPLRPHLDGSP